MLYVVVTTKGDDNFDLPSSRFALQIIGNKSDKIFFIFITMKEFLPVHALNHVLFNSFDVNP